MSCIATRRGCADDGAKIPPECHHARSHACRACMAMPYWTGLKHDPSTRHIPVQIISVIDDMRRVLKLGAARAHDQTGRPRKTGRRQLSSLKNLSSGPIKKLLLVEDDEVLRRSDHRADRRRRHRDNGGAERARKRLKCCSRKGSTARLSI